MIIIGIQQLQPAFLLFWQTEPFWWPCGVMYHLWGSSLGCYAPMRSGSRPDNEDLTRHESSRKTFGLYTIWFTIVDGCEILHQLIDGKVYPSILLGFQPSFWWCRICNDQFYDSDGGFLETQGAPKVNAAGKTMVAWLFHNVSRFSQIHPNPIPYPDPIHIPAYSITYPSHSLLNTNFEWYPPENDKHVPLLLD